MANEVSMRLVIKKKMSELTLHKISYKDLRDYKYKNFDDPYGIVAFMTDHLRETLLACPYNVDENKTALYVMTDGNVAVGRLLEFETRIVANGEIVPTQTGSSLFVENSYRPKGVGVDLLMEQKFCKDYSLKIGSLFSSMVVPMIKKIRYVLFDIPQYVSIRRSQPIIATLGIKGVPLKICSAIADIPIYIMNGINDLRRKQLYKKVVIKKESIIPNWVGELAMSDSHKFKELHTTEWFQWNLDYNMNGYPGDKQSFYAIYKKNGEPLGFFMTKERFEEVAGRYHNIIRGTIVEWATADSNLLSESDLNLLALKTFSHNTFHVLTVTTDDDTKKKLKKIGFVKHGILQMNLYDKKKQFPDIYDQSQWRLRYGCGNTIIFGQVTADY